MAVVTGAGQAAGMLSRSGHSYNKHTAHIGTDVHCGFNTRPQLSGATGMRVHHTRARTHTQTLTTCNQLLLVTADIQRTQVVIHCDLGAEQIQGRKPSQ